jgi:hypothetical protein
MILHGAGDVTSATDICREVEMRYAASTLTCLLALAPGLAAAAPGNVAVAKVIGETVVGATAVFVHAAARHVDAVEQRPGASFRRSPREARHVVFLPDP